MFYRWLWRLLPGPTAAKAAQAMVLFLAVVAVLFTWVFPQVAALLPIDDITVGQ